MLKTPLGLSNPISKYVLLPLRSLRFGDRCQDISAITTSLHDFIAIFQTLSQDVLAYFETERKNVSLPCSTILQISDASPDTLDNQYSNH